MSLHLVYVCDLLRISVVNVLVFESRLSLGYCDQFYSTNSFLGESDPLSHGNLVGKVLVCGRNFPEVQFTNLISRKRFQRLFFGKEAVKDSWIQIHEFRSDGFRFMDSWIQIHEFRLKSFFWRSDW